MAPIERPAMAAELERIRAFWPSFSANATTLDEMMREFKGTEQREFGLAVSWLLSNWKESWAPKPEHFHAALGATRPRPYGTAHLAPRAPFCRVCGTVDLYENAYGRLRILHAEDCTLAMEDEHRIDIPSATAAGKVWLGGRSPVKASEARRP